jgi:hypothetical protein
VFAWIERATRQKQKDPVTNVGLEVKRAWLKRRAWQYEQQGLENTLYIYISMDGWHMVGNDTDTAGRYHD